MNIVPNVLLIEDDPTTAEIIISLCKLEKIALMVEHEVEMAKEVISEYKPKIVIVDIMLGTNTDKNKEKVFSAGYELASWISTKFPDIYIIGYSGVSNPRYMNAFEKFGGVFISKLQSEDVLVNTIKQMLNDVGKNERIKTPKIFIVHGHDDLLKLQLKNYLQNVLKFSEPIILHERSIETRTIIQKFEEESIGVDIVFVLLSPDPENTNNPRQNVLLELGYFLGKMQNNKGKIILLHSKGAKLPTDLDGLIYIDVTNGIEYAGESIRKEIKEYIVV
jgi:predicted nucleotide-binding protein